MKRLKDNIKEFLFSAPESLTEMLYRAGIVCLISMSLLYGVMLLDGKDHNLGALNLGNSQIYNAFRFVM